MGAKLLFLDIETAPILMTSWSMRPPYAGAVWVELVGGDRAESHGDMHTHFAHVAALWTAYLKLDRQLNATDVPHMMALLKIARTQSGGVNVDDWIDGAGYMACAGEVATKEYRR